MDYSKIEWTTHTFNPWWGCIKISTGCENCYAELFDKRFGEGHWGPNSSRKIMSESYWKKPIQWNKAAKRAGIKAKVFCASMADIFEGHPDTIPHLSRLFSIIEKTPNLVWQLLTKRPQNIMKLVPEHWKVKFPSNVWIGASIENQYTADTRIWELIQVPASILFLSCEPLLGAINLEKIKSPEDPENQVGKYTFSALSSGGDHYDDENGDVVDGPYHRAIDWVIVGGESGNKARPMHPDWVRAIKDQCVGEEIPFFFKQWGQWHPFYDRDKDDPDWRNIPKESNKICRIDLTGQHGFHGERVVYFNKVGKQKSGSMIDNSIHHYFPE